MLRLRLRVASIGAYHALCSGRRHFSSSGTNPGLRDAKHMSFGVDPKKLDLGLDLDNMDFTAIMNETRAALAKEKQGDVDFHAEIEKLNAALQEAERKPAAPSRAERSVRGIVGAGGVHDANTPHAALEQARRERAESRAPRYTLVDSLRDCALSGNWSRAMDLFEDAVGKSCQQAREGTVDPHAPLTAGSEMETRCFERLQKVNATLPTADGYRARKNLHGVLRWNSNHVYWLLRVLFETDRMAEARRVWDVLRAIGFVELHLNPRTLNGIITLVRNTSGRDATAPSQLVTPVFPSHPKTAEQLEHEKAFRRELTMTLEALAQTKRIPLGLKNQKTAQRARLADTFHRDDAVGDASSSMTNVPIKVGDFSGLLRVAQSEESTQRVLDMMSKLGITKTSETYAALITALHNPTYRLNGVEASEIVAGPVKPVRHGGGEAANEDGPSTSAQEATTADEDDQNPSDTDAHQDSDTKAKYEAYKEKRIAAARRWFHECPEAERRADVFNAMLYLLRSRAHKDSFDALLLEFRGAPVRTAEEEAGVLAEQSAAAVPPIHTPHWRAPPIGKTFELLIQRSRYLHDWHAMWDLYEEMQQMRVRGTRKLYQALLVEARQHPPSKILARTHMDVPTFVLQLYDNMKKDHMDVRSLDSTLSVVNAWSATRGQRRWS